MYPNNNNMDYFDQKEMIKKRKTVPPLMPSSVYVNLKERKMK